MGLVLIESGLSTFPDEWMATFIGSFDSRYVTPVVRLLLPAEKRPQCPDGDYREALRYLRANATPKNLRRIEDILKKARIDWDGAILR